MLLQTNSYIVPQDKRAEHARLLRRFRQVLARLGCDRFEVYEQVGSNWNTGEITGRVVQIMRFRDRRHQLAVQAAERSDPVAQAVIAEFCNLINFPYQQQQGLFAIGFYNAVLPASPARGHDEQDAHEAEDARTAAAAGAPFAASPVEPSEQPVTESIAEPTSDLDASAGELAREQTLSSEEVPAPALDAEEPVFAEGTEGIIAAAEQLSDEQLDAGGDAAVASAIAGPSVAPSPNGTGEHSPDDRSDEPQRPEPSQADQSQADQSQTDPSQAEQPQGSNGHVPEQGPGDELDLSSLLDPHLGPDNGHAESKADGGALREWGDDLSLEGVLGHDEPLPMKNAALETEPAHDRNHVSQ